MINLITLVLTDSARSAAFVFFILAILFTILIFYLYIQILTKNEIYGFYTHELSDHKDKIVPMIADFDIDLSLTQLMKNHLWPFMIRFL